MDVPDCDRARALADELGDAVTFYKIGLELMMSGGYFELLDWMVTRDKKVFCDLKFFDIPATVGSAVRQLKDRGATFVTVHGNRSIMEAAAENKGDSLKVLGVTVLTSLDRGDLDDLGFECDIGDLVLSRAKQALDSGCDGVISSGLESSEAARVCRREAAGRVTGYPAGRQQARRGPEARCDGRDSVFQRRRPHCCWPPDSRRRKSARRSRSHPGLNSSAIRVIDD